LNIVDLLVLKVDQSTNTSGQTDRAGGRRRNDCESIYGVVNLRRCSLLASLHLIGLVIRSLAPGIL